MILGFFIVGNPLTYQQSSILFSFCWIIVSPLFPHRRLQHYWTSSGYFPLSLSLYIVYIYIYITIMKNGESPYIPQLQTHPNHTSMVTSPIAYAISQSYQHFTNITSTWGQHYKWFISSFSSNHIPIDCLQAVHLLRTLGDYVCICIYLVCEISPKISPIPLFSQKKSHDVTASPPLSTARWKFWNSISSIANASIFAWMADDSAVDVRSDEFWGLNQLANNIGIFAGRLLTTLVKPC